MGRWLWVVTLLCGSMSDAAAVVAPAANPHLTGADVSDWLDGYMPYALDRGDIAGAVVTVVKDGEIIVKRGYGYADVEKRTPVDPDTTLFRPASVSKLLTWTAVMQLVEAGKLDLDVDINAYLDFKVPARGKPITLRHLLTHTAGFEANMRRMWVTEETAAAGGAAIGPYLKEWVPRQIFEPGTVPAYSNYGTSLAGYIVERVSGLPFESYIERYIFAPLDMTHSSFRLPLPPHLRALVSSSYRLGSGKPQPFEVTPSSPAGALSATGSDMARFMIAHLRNMGGADSPLLKAATAAQMYTPQKHFAQPLHTMALGFYEIDVNGERVLGHAGDTVTFHSQLFLFRDQGVGVFVSLNSAGANGATGPIRSQLIERFADRYFPRPEVAANVDLDTAKTQAKALAAGSFMSSRRSETGVGRLGVLSQVRLTDNRDGTITFAKFKDVSGQPVRFAPIAPWVWRAVGGKQRLAAVVENGRVTGFGVDASSPFVIYQRVDGYRSALWLKPLLIAAFVVLGSTALAWPIAALTRRRYRRSLPWSAGALKAYRASRATIWLMLLSWLGWLALLSWAMGDVVRLDARLDKWIVLLGICSLVAMVGGIAATTWNLVRIRRDGRSVLPQLWALLIVLAMVVLAYAGVLSGFVDFALKY